MRVKKIIIVRFCLFCFFINSFILEIIQNLINCHSNERMKEFTQFNRFINN